MYKRITKGILGFLGLIILYRVFLILANIHYIQDFINMLSFNVMHNNSNIDAVALSNGIHFTKNILDLVSVVLLFTIALCVILLISICMKSKETITDPLCKVYNRRYFNSYIDRKKDPIKTKHSVLMLDIDYFKEYNDNYGHQAGDKTLRLIAKCLKHSCRKSDTIIRFGGEEFCIFLPDTNKDIATDIAKRILNNVKDLNIEHDYSEISNHVTVSIGIASYNSKRGNCSFEDMIKKADKKLYKAKSMGKNTYFN